MTNISPRAGSSARDKRNAVTVTLAIALFAAGAQAAQQYDPTWLKPKELRRLLAGRDQAAGPSPQLSPQLVPQPLYETRQVHDPDGTGKFYMGREIAQTMGPGGIPWLDRPQRVNEEHPEVVMDALDLREGEVVADLGAGSGFFTFRMAPKVGKTGKVLAVDVQEEMLDAIRRRAAEAKVTNVEEIKDTETDPKLPANGVDLVLMVDVYHELSYPFEVMTKVRQALKPDGRVVFVEYRKEDPKVPIKHVHKMSVEQLDREMAVVGLKRVETVETLPLQHIVIFGKSE
jgi:ubiquinone/menaquinone biosynthesis C-methylase UbiE